MLFGNCRGFDSGQRQPYIGLLIAQVCVWEEARMNVDGWMDGWMDLFFSLLYKFHAKNLSFSSLLVLCTVSGFLC